MSKENYFKGFAHCHSTFSYDGKYSYSELKEIFIQHGLQFVCITEHIEYLDQVAIEKIIDECRMCSDERFLFIPGIEMDEFVVYFIGIDHIEIDFSSSKKIFNSLKSVAKLCVFSHPIKAKYKYPEWLIENCDGVEVWNTKHDGIHYPRKQSLQLLNQVRETHPQAIALAGMDFHDKKQLSSANIQLLNKGPLTEGFILDEIKNGRYVIYKGNQSTQEIKPIIKHYLWFRICLMDWAHKTHLAMTQRGISVPKPLKRFIRKVMEGK